MFNRLSRPLVFAFAVLFAVMVPLALAQAPGAPAPGAGTSGQHPRETLTPGMQSPQTGTMGAQDTIFATVTEVNKQQKTVKLRMQDGDMVELRVPERLMADLNQGDSVQVSIRKAEAGMGGMQSPGAQPSRPSTGTETRPRSGQ